MWYVCRKTTKEEMEEKKLTEKESLELITNMIQQTKKDSAIGSGDTFLIWGYLCVLCSLSVVAMACFAGGGRWGWLYFAIPVLGFAVAGINARRLKKKYSAPATYSASSINNIWACLSFVLAAYAIRCLMDWHSPAGWSGMFLLGLLLPAIGTYSTGVILKEKLLQVCGMVGVILGSMFLHKLCCEGPIVTIKWPIIMAISMVITLVVPGHYLNYKSRKQNS